MSSCFDVMIDVETTGTHPDRNAILQIAAVRFNFATGEVDHAFFNRCLTMPPTRAWEEDTRAWWSRQKAAVFQQIVARGEDARQVMKEFGQWAGYAHDEPLRFWAKPISFDYAFVASYFHEFGVENPFHYRHAIDLNSFRRGRKLVTGVVESSLPFQGDEHNALFDALHQVRLALETKEL